MKSFTTLKSLFTTLSQNTSTANNTLGGILINDQHRYLLLKYFDNEKFFTMLTIGPKTLTLTTAVLASGSTSATLTAAWTDISCHQLVVFSNSEQRTVYFTQGSASVTWQSATTSIQTSASISCIGVQSYPLPANVSKIKNSTITIGQLVYSPAPIQSIQEWTKLNALPYASSIPAYFFIYDKEINFWPIPATSGEVMTLNCQISIPDMTYEDYTTGTLTASGMVAGSNAVIGSATAWNTAFPTTTDLTFANLFINATPPKGDGLYYQIKSVTDATSLVLTKPVVYAPNISGANYTIGQYPLLQQDFHDAIVYGALRIYFSSIVKDDSLYQTYNGIFNEKQQQIEMYLSNKQNNVDLSVSPVVTNPNLYYFSS